MTVVRKENEEHRNGGKKEAWGEMDRGYDGMDTLMNRGGAGSGSVIKQREVYMKITRWGNGLTKDI